MKKYNVVLLLSFMLLSLGSCETVDFGDTNENRNGALELNTGALLTGAQVRYTAGIGFRDWLANPHLYVQYQAQPVYPDPSRYAETPTDWAPYYSQTLMNLQQILNLSEDPEVTEDPAYQSSGSINNQVGVAKIMRVLIFKRLTDVYGDIPYTDALNPEVQSPAYTAQEDIYMDFISELREARDMLNPAENRPVGDIYYNGDVTKWRKFANSLLMSVAIQMSEAAPGVAESTFVEALNNEFGVIETIEDEAWYMPENVATLDNPWVAFRPADYNMAEFIQDAMQGDNPDYSNDTFDERLRIISTAPESPGLEYGLQEGEAAGTNARISTRITAPTAPFPIYTSAYAYLHRAEAAARGWTEESAEEMLRLGIIQSYESMTVHFGMGDHVSAANQLDITEEAEAFAAARLADAAQVGMLQVIGEEKWAALFPQGFEAWNEWRRTGYPNLTPSPDPLNDGGIPTRYLYPINEVNLNNANYQTGVNNLSPASDKNTSRVWWNQ